MTVKKDPRGSFLTIKSPVVVASCISFAPGLGRELSHSAAPPLPRSAFCASWVPSGRWRPALRFVVASCISFAPGLGRELSHSAAPPLLMSANRTHWEPEVFSATYTPPPKMIPVPFAPTGRETLRGFLQTDSPEHCSGEVFACLVFAQPMVPVAVMESSFTSP